MISRPEVILFEDDPRRSEKLQEDFEQAMAEYDSGIEISEPDISESSPDLETLRQALQGDQPALLVMLDWDLGERPDGITRGDVKEVCTEEDIPLVIYHRPESSFTQTEQFEEYDTDDIKFESSKPIEEVGRDGAGIAVGFQEIQNRTSQVFDEYLEGNSSSSPAPMIYQILNAPESVAGELEQYNWGTPDAMFGAPDDNEDFDQTTRIQRWSTHLGYWIWNELLTFPGVLLNPTATAAYLDINHKTFQENHEYLDALEDARYDGPFWKLDYWFWLPELDSVRGDVMNDTDSQLPIGPEIFDRLGLPAIERSECHDENEGGHPGARYYGAMIEAPVCKEHSKRPEGLIPPGATRTRVSSTKYEKYMPWMR